MFSKNHAFTEYSITAKGKNATDLFYCTDNSKNSFLLNSVQKKQQKLGSLLTA